MDATLGKMRIDLILGDSAFARNLNKNSAMIRAFGKNVASTFTGIGEGLTKGLTVPLAAAATAAVLASESIEKGYKRIQIATGATGEALAGLRTDFDAVARQSEHSFMAVGNVIGELNTLTGATGPVLQELTDAVMELSDMLGTDAKQTAAEFGKSLNLWKIPAEQGEARLDRLFKLTQVYGIGLSGILEGTRQLMPVMKAANFTFDETAEFVAMLEKHGIGASEVLPGLKKSMTEAAQAGLPFREVLFGIVEALRDMPEDQAMRIGAGLFGARGGASLVTAIREGVIDLGRLGEALQGTVGSVRTMGEATDSLGDKLRTTLNRAKLAIKPVGDNITRMIKGVLPYANTAIDTVGMAVAWLDRLPAPLKDTGIAIGVVVAALGPLSLGIGAATIAGTAAVSGFLKLGAVLIGLAKPMLLVATVGTVIVGVVQGVRWLADEFRSVRETIASVASASEDLWARMKFGVKVTGLALELAIDSAWKYAKERLASFADTFADTLSALSVKGVMDFSKDVAGIRAYTADLRGQLEEIKEIRDAAGRLIGMSTPIPEPTPLQKFTAGYKEASGELEKQLDDSRARFAKLIGDIDKEFEGRERRTGRSFWKFFADDAKSMGRTIGTVVNMAKVLGDVMPAAGQAAPGIESVAKSLEDVAEKAPRARSEVLSFVGSYDALRNEALGIRLELFPEEAYREAVKKLDTLRDKFSDVIDHEAYSRSLKRYQDALVAADDTLKGRLFRGTESWAEGFSSTLTELAFGAKISFREIAVSFGKMVTQIMIYSAMVKPFLDALKGWTYGMPSGSIGENPQTVGAPMYPDVYASGGVISGGRELHAFARGGVVSKPTLFPMAEGAGLMGEAGPEAILPLTRVGGDLGVRAITPDVHAQPIMVQVIDQRRSGERPTVEESSGPDGERLIRVLIRDEMKAAIGDGGLDRVMGSAFGATRRGARR